MAVTFDKSLPTLSVGEIENLERILHVALPGEYKRFLLKRNGGVVPEGVTCRLSVPIAWKSAHGPRRVVEDALVELFCYEPGNRGKRLQLPSSIVAENREIDEDEILPHGVVGIGYTKRKGIICLSCNDEDAGRVYYWCYYWRHPDFAAHFDAKMEHIKETIPDYEKIKARPGTRENVALGDRLAYATLTEIAPSIDEFLNKLDMSNDLGV